MPKSLKQKCKECCDKETLRVVSIFHSIDGEVNGFEGAGRLATFVRLAGCNLCCSWCDTDYAQPYNSGELFTVSQVLHLIKDDKVTITGGEPLLQAQGVQLLVTQLLERSDAMRITIETNGTQVPPAALRWPASVSIVYDYKLPSAKLADYRFAVEPGQLRTNDVVKFVCADGNDYRRALDVAHEITHAPDYAQDTIEGNVLFAFSPAGPINSVGNLSDWAKQLAEKLIEDNRTPGILPVRTMFSLQLHKLLWPEYVGTSIER
jgi:7-carboxy-7-deazaguanine synthase